LKEKQLKINLKEKFNVFIYFLFFQVDLNIRINVEDVDHIHEKIYALSSSKINVRATLDAKAASTNESIRSWDMNVNVDLSPGHLVNNFKVQMMRKTPGEKNLKVCVRLTYLKLIVLILKQIYLLEITNK